MCNLGGSSTNTNQIYGRNYNEKTSNRNSLSTTGGSGNGADLGTDVSVNKPKTEPTSGITSSDNYQG